MHTHQHLHQGVTYYFHAQPHSPSLFHSIMQKLTLACLLVAVAAAAARPNDSHYTDRYDNVNLDELISNRRLLVPYVKCVLDQGKCSPDGKELKGECLIEWQIGSFC